jgi:hypothetical protein
MAEMLGTVLAVNKRVQERPTDTNCCCSKSDGLQDIRSPLEAAVDVDFKLIKNLWAVLP